ncbi:hypothetical protein SGQ44_14710 [Flavobacterium sp. Fl-77]|uniref:Uncharacterized protein n=1 Tax=Flavobacterium flavipigmentatum TaxID=2893884 RepID=A0AAJ2SJ96_9FLAO|nr:MULTISPECIES: hypothetical protein [unclassified Flavobacterium]MDX6183585.1 hypothetical protein [Flavobacterium sp. Fl-33]MDX6187013.1 hypothetical protein [Flavobacterium sp. Fl-77]UFH40255.1 hypothetical protein LNP22_08240 [Flavobacterium sp. F-70]
MSITIKILKIIAIISFLIIPGLDENGTPNLAFMMLCLYQFFYDICNASTVIFWEGFIIIPIIAALIVFFISKSYKILFFCFLVLLIPLTYASGLITNYSRINFWFLFTFLLFILSSIGVIILAQKTTVKRITD